VKRSDSKFSTDFSSLYQKLTGTINFCVERFVGRFIGTHFIGADEGFKRFTAADETAAFVLFRYC
jgi:hypothetical protein